MTSSIHEVAVANARTATAVFLAAIAAATTVSGVAAK
jgi:hypothetical protein